MRNSPDVRLASTPQSPEHFEARVKKLILSGAFRKMIDHVGRYTEAEGREAGMAAYGYGGKIETDYHLPGEDPMDELDYADPNTRYTSYADRRGLFTDSNSGKLHEDLLLDAHSHPIHDFNDGRRTHPMDVFQPSTTDLETWGDQAQWGNGAQSTHPRLLNGILVREGEFNKILLMKRSEHRPWVPRYLQYEDGRGTNFMHKVLESSGIVLATVDFSLDTQAYRQQAEQVAATLAETK